LARGALEKVEQPVPGTYLLVDLIKYGQKSGALTVGSNVVVTGGDKVALDSVGLLKSLGAKNITILFREGEDQMPGGIVDASRLEQEGVHVKFKTAINRLFGEKSKLTGIEIVDVETKKTEAMDAQTLFFGAGRFPELIFTKVLPKVEEEENQENVETQDRGPLKWVAQEPYKLPAFKDESGFFSKADAMSDYQAAIKAIGAGRRVAASIHQMMFNVDPFLDEKVLMEKSVVQNVYELYESDVKKSPRTIMPLQSFKGTGNVSELEKGFDENMARKEAGRCLKCGLICYMHTGKQKTKAA
jgi:formate dehydrogenase (NADP+) beta subunit